MKSTTIPFGEWLPDQGEYNNPGATIAKNVFPHPKGYAPWPSAVDYSDALNARCRGSVSVRDKSGTQYLFAGDETTLNQLSDTSWTEVSATAGVYTSGSEERWEFSKWDEQIIATNYTDAPQVITLGGAKFADLSGSPPKAKHIAVVRDFVVLGYVNTGSAEIPYRVHWSGYQDETTWAVSAVTQADVNDLKGNGGAIQRIFGGEYGVVFQEHSIWRMSYIGTPIVFQFDETGPGIGLVSRGMAAQFGDLIFFLSPRGFYMLRDGSKADPIGSTKVDKYVLSDIDYRYLSRCSAIIDPSSNKVFFSYPGSGNVSGTPNKVVVYDYSINKWSYSEQETEDLLGSGSGSYTLEGLDAVNSSLDALTFSLDDPFWAGSNLQISKFTSGHKLAFLTGDPMTASISTSEFQAHPGRRSVLRQLRPLVEAGGNSSLSISLLVRNKLEDPKTRAPGYSNLITEETHGQYAIRSNARFHTVRLDISGKWDIAHGIEAEAFPAGWR